MARPTAALPARTLLQTLPLQIAEQIAGAIIDERYEPRERLKETELAAHFGVSRATVREALRILAARNLVRIDPQRGAYVSELSLDEIEDMFEIRIVLVGLVARRLAGKASAAAARKLDGLLERLTASLADGDAYARASSATSIALAELTESEHLVQIMTSYAHQFGRYARLGLQDNARRRQSLQLWSELFNAIVSGDVEKAETLNRRLAIENRDAALRVLKSRYGEGDEAAH